MYGMAVVPMIAPGKSGAMAWAVEEAEVTPHAAKGAEEAVVA